MANVVIEFGPELSELLGLMTAAIGRFAEAEKAEGDETPETPDQLAANAVLNGLAHVSQIISALGGYNDEEFARLAELNGVLNAKRQANEFPITVTGLSA